MINSLSILMPTYNDVCVELVRSLHKQASAIDRLDFEIIVLDDGSKDKGVVEKNMEINLLSHCRYLRREENKGRAVTRNELVAYAKGEWLLFIDSDMVARNDEYLHLYVEMDEAEVTYGGYEVNGDKLMLKGNLRFAYESQYDGNRNASKRAAHPYDDFHTSNFLVRKSIMTAHPLDERFTGYGYEDVIWGKTLRAAGITIRHVDNPLSFEIFEDNTEFVAKTTAGVNTLVKFSNELRDYSRIIATADKLERWHVAKPIAATFKMAQNAIKNSLIYNKPNIFLFNIYKVGMYLMLSER